MTKRGIQLVLAVSVTVLLATACSGGGKAPVPRARAYPRIEAYPAQYRALDSLPLNVEVNSSATASVRRGTNGSWAADIVYPRYKARIYLTVIALDADDPEAIARAVRSRLERASLNLGDSRYISNESVNAAGLNIQIVRAQSAIPTPVQLIADDGRRHLVSATAFVDFTPSVSATDSLAPVTDALCADIEHLARQLR